MRRIIQGAKPVTHQAPPTTPPSGPSGIASAPAKAIHHTVSFEGAARAHLDGASSSILPYPEMPGLAPVPFVQPRGGYAAGGYTSSGANLAGRLRKGEVVITEEFVRGLTAFKETIAGLGSSVSDLSAVFDKAVSDEVKRQIAEFASEATGPVVR